MKAKNDLFVEDFSGDYFEFLESYTPIIVHTFLHDALGHKNMKTLIENCIKEEKEKKVINSSKLFVLLFLIIESDIENEIGLIEEAIELLKESYIQHSILLKLLMLMYFKVTKDSPIEKRLRKEIIKVNLRVNPKDKGSIILQNIDDKRIKKSLIDD